MTDPIRVSIIGENEIAREGLRRILGERAFDARSVRYDGGPIAAADLGDSADHVVVVHVGADADALEICRAVRPDLRAARLVMMGDQCEVAVVRQAFAYGVDGFIVKQIALDPLVNLLTLVALGEKVVPTGFVDRLTAMNRTTSSRTPAKIPSDINLSERELGILHCLIDGDANKRISRRLGIAEATVKVHIKTILRKLNVLNRTQAAIWAINHGLERDPRAIRPDPADARADQG